MKFFLQLIIICFFFSGVNAQRICGSNEYSAQMKHVYTERRGVTASSNMHSRDTAADEIITVPVVIHLLFNTAAQNLSDEQIFSQLTVLAG